jgi:hypothetical protein
MDRWAADEAKGGRYRIYPEFQFGVVFREQELWRGKRRRAYVNAHIERNKDAIGDCIPGWAFDSWDNPCVAMVSVHTLEAAEMVARALPGMRILDLDARAWKRPASGEWRSA